MCLRLSPWSFGPGPVAARHLVARTIRSRAPRAADDLLGPAARRKVAAQRVGVGGIEENHALPVGDVHDREGGLLVGLPAEGHRPQADLAYLQAGAAQRSDLHASTAPTNSST